MKRTVIVIGAVLALGVPSLAAAQNREQQQMIAEIRMLQDQLQHLQLSVNTLADAVTAVKDSTKTLSTKIDQNADATRKGFADQSQAIANISETERGLGGKANDTIVRIGSLTQELEGIRQAVTALQTTVAQNMTPPAPTGGDPLAAIGAAGVSNPPGSATSTAPPSTAAVTPPATTSIPIGAPSPQRMYDSAWSDFLQSQYDSAIQGFTQYLKTFPASPDAPQARYYIAESLSAQHKWKEAIQAYDVFLATDKGATFEPDAYYRRGFDYESLGQKDKAREDFAYVVAHFPDSTVAALAKQGLDRIK